MAVYRTSFVAPLLAGFALGSVACSNVRSEAVSEANRDEVSRRIASSKDLTPEEANLFAAYLIRQQVAKNLNPAAAPPLDRTVEDIIAAQRSWIAEQEQAAARAEAEARAEREREQAVIAALRAAVSAAALAIEFTPSNPYQGRFREWIGVRARITNTGQKPLKGVRGRLIFKNTFGQEVYRMTLNVEADIAPSASIESTWGHDYNQFRDEDRTLRSLDLARGTVEWEPIHLVFADGTSAQVPGSQQE